jgi:hypothetical protein
MELERTYSAGGRLGQRLKGPDSRPVIRGQCETKAKRDAILIPRTAGAPPVRRDSYFFEQAHTLEEESRPSDLCTMDSLARKFF